MLPQLTRRAVLALPLALGLAACSGKKDGGDGVSVGDGGPDELFAETASFEVLAGTPQRVMVGLTTKDNRVLHGGSVSFTIRPVEAGKQPVELTSTATFLAVPRTPAAPSTAVIGYPSDGIGVYAANDITFPSPGFWTISIDVALPKPQRLETAVEVLAKAQVPAPGEPAPKTANATASGPEMPIEAIDSRSGTAGLGDELADPILHKESVAEILDAGRPCVVIVSTPTFCTSKFCGPLTDIVAELAVEASTQGSDIGFVHLEVWRNFEARQVNKSAADWILRDGAPGNEPWVFTINRQGTISQRWDNLVSEAELRTAIASL